MSAAFPAFPQDQNPNPKANGTPPDTTGAPGSIKALLFGPSPAPQDPVADRLSRLDPIDHTIKLTTEASSRLANRLCREIESYRQVNRKRLDALNFWRLAYEVMPPGTSTRWENSADVPSPLTRIACNAHHTKLNQQLGGAVPPFAAVARTPDALAAAPLIEDCMTAVLDNANWPQVMDDLHRELAVAGNVFVKTVYSRKYQRLPKTKVDLDDETVDSALRSGLDFHEAIGHGIRGVNFGHEEELIYDGVEFQPIKWEDGIILPSMIRNSDEAYGIGERKRLTGFDLVEGVQSHIYDEEAVAELLNHQGDPRPEDRLEREEEIGRIETGYGGGPVGDPEDALYRDYEIYELCWKMVPPGEIKSGYDDRSAAVSGAMLAKTPAPVWTVVHLHFQSRKIIGIQYLPYRHGRPYYMLERYILRTNELWGMSVAEILAALQDADTAVRNQIIDLQDYMVNCRNNYFYTGLSGWDPDKTIAQMARPVKLEDLDQIRPMEVPTLPAEAYQLRSQFKDEADLLTGTSNPTLGKETQGNKTLGEVQIVTSAAQSIFEEVGARVARQHAMLWDQARWLTAQYGLRSDSGQIEYRRTAMPDQAQFAQIDPKMLSAKVDLVPSGIQQLSDMASKVQQSTLVMTQFMNLPFVRANPMAFLPSITLVFSSYLNALKYPERQRLEGTMAADLTRMMEQQIDAMDKQAQMARAGVGQALPLEPGGGPPGGGGAGPGPPPGAVGGAPAPLPAPAEMPPAVTAVTAQPPPLGAGEEPGGSP